MTTRTTAEINLTPPDYFGDIPADLQFYFDSMRRYLIENFSILHHAILADHLILETATIQNRADEVDLIIYNFKPYDLITGLGVNVHLSGAYSNASASDDFRIRYYLGGTLLHTLYRQSGNVADAGWEANFHMTVRSEGTAGTIIDYADLLDGTKIYASADPTVHTFDTTQALQGKLTIQWDNAKSGNILTVTQGQLQFMRSHAEHQ